MATDEIVIDDYSNPRFSPEARAMLDAIASMPALPLEPEALMAAASERTGLDHFGDDWFREPLDIVCRAIPVEAGLNAVGRVTAGSSLVNMLANRLRLEDLLRRHPEIEEVPIARPIIIVGLPRTGTTHLHNLLSADPQLRSLPYWESLEPVPETIPPPDPDPRIERTAMATGFTDVAMPYFKAMHEMTPEHVHEEVQLQTLTLASMLLETQWHVPTYRDWWKSTDQTPAYRYLRRALQALQWLRGGERWVLKSPQHLEQFGRLMTVFPDATVICTHRDPVSVTVSFATMASYSARLSIDHPDPRAIGKYWTDRIQDMLTACVRDRDVLPAEQSLDVRFDDFMADEWGTVERIYEKADQPFPDSSRAALSAYNDHHRRNRFGRVRYDVTTFGIDPAERESALAGYRQRFGV
jgi:sulfotransferase family protein